MLDRRFIVDHADAVQANADRKGDDCDIAAIVRLDGERKAVTTQRETLKAELNRINKAVGPLLGMLKGGKDGDILDAAVDRALEQIGSVEHATALADIRALVAQGADALQAAMGAASAIDKELAGQLRELEARLHEQEILVPNMAHPQAPPGIDETDNVVRSEHGTTRVFAGFKPKPHYEVAEALGMIHAEAAGRIAGSGFTLLTGDLARLERALVSFFLDLHTTRHGYTEVNPPHLVNEATAFTTGYLPKMADDMYFVKGDGLYLIPTAEAPLTSIHAGAILEEAELPKQYTAHTPCYRREAGAAGAETRGLQRVHQFNKVELFTLATPANADAAHLALRGHAEAALELLGLPYRVLELCVGDLSFAGARCWDLEVFAAASQQWLEVSSVSTFADFQARRGSIRYRDDAGALHFCHTINGSGLATPRTLVAILENYQQADGSVAVPEVLRPYFGGLESIQKP